MRPRWNLVLLLCLGSILALGSALMAASPRSSLAMQDQADAFCPTPMENDDETGFAPRLTGAGVVEVRDLTPPVPGEEPPPDGGPTARLRLTRITLAQDACMLHSYFYPGAIVTVLSGEVMILVEPATSSGPAPAGQLLVDGGATVDEKDLSAPFSLVEGDWLTISNGAIVGFKNEQADDAVFMVAGLKPSGDPVGGGCGNGCRSRP